MNMMLEKIYHYFTVLDGKLMCEIVFVFLFLFMTFVLIFRFIKDKKIRDKVLSSRFIEANRFLKSKNPIYKNGEFSKSGCYVILIFSCMTGMPVFCGGSPQRRSYQRTK